MSTFDFYLTSSYFFTTSNIAYSQFCCVLMQIFQTFSSYDLKTEFIKE